MPFQDDASHQGCRYEEIRGRRKEFDKIVQRDQHADHQQADQCFQEACSFFHLVHGEAKRQFEGGQECHDINQQQLVGEGQQNIGQNAPTDKGDEHGRCKQ